MTKWLLIYWVVTGATGSYGGLHNSTAVASFEDEATCKAAYQALREITKDAYQIGVWGVCVPEGKR